MQDLFAAVDRWRRAGHAVACATAVATWGSAPRPAGARMVIADDGRMAGSVSGGCVEAAVVEAAMDVLVSGQGRREDFGVADADALAVGLSCGGRLSVWIEPWRGPETAAPDRWESTLRRVVCRQPPVEDESAIRFEARALRLDDGRDRLRTADGSDGTLGSGDSAPLDPMVDRALEALSPGAAEIATFDGVEVFLERPAPPRRLVIVGAVHIAQVLVDMARAGDFETVVVDPRTAFATAERFPTASLVRHDWPDAALADLGLDESTFVVSLSHDPKLDLPTLQTALASDAVAYVGALGSRRTHAQRCEALAGAGVGPDDLARIRAPIGLDLGGRRPAEIAVAILAEIVAVANRGAAARSTP